MERYSQQRAPMPVPDKQPPTAIQIERQVERFLAERIPAGWSLQARRNEALAGRYQVDLLAEIASPAGETAVLAVEIKRNLEPRDVLHAVEQISEDHGQRIASCRACRGGRLPRPSCPCPAL